MATYTIAPNGERVDIVSVLSISFAPGIAYAITSGVADTDTAAVAADELTGESLYA